MTLTVSNPGGVENAKAIEPWSKFDKITDDLTSISDVESDTKTIDYSLPYEVYSTAGVNMGSDLSRLSPGLYIIRQGCMTAKTRVK